MTPCGHVIDNGVNTTNGLSAQEAVVHAIRYHCEQLSGGLHSLSSASSLACPDQSPSSSPAAFSSLLSRPALHAPLVLLFGKTFSAAAGIAFHNTETVHRVAIKSITDGGGGAVASSRPVGMYKIGSHYNMYPSLFCTCPSFQFHCLSKPDAVMCKHLLAVALRLGGDEGLTAAIPTYNLSEDDFIVLVGSFPISERAGGSSRGSH